jgi:hypothetical protein
MAVTVNHDGVSSYQSEVYQYAHKTYLGKVWILRYQIKIEAGLRLIDYSYTDSGGKVLYTSSKPLLEVEEEQLFQQFRAWVFHHDSKLLHVEIVEIEVKAKKRVVKGATSK